MRTKYQFKTWYLCSFSKNHFNHFSPADQTHYLCRQCRSRWDGSSGSTLIAILFSILDFASVDMSKFKDETVHFIKLRDERIKADANRSSFNQPARPHSLIMTIMFCQNNGK